METEHGELRRLKKELRDTATEPSLDTESLVDAARFVSNGLRDHIRKENEILYPMALDTLPEETWATLNERSQAVGPCRFATVS